ncbi:uncharacterized protein LOC130687584 [Daphnia carinata]|uniref:uncharacterized protein LOC130687584 n=1 Tax=Daphnia carinata TaxID=120202 RepID=UPI00257C6DDD|nr:uncharacterized protein LOC130687584 [Daphnia carinata]
MPHALTLVRQPKPLKPFNGDPREWAFFLGNFNSQVSNGLLDDSQRLVLLRESLTPQVANRIINLLYDGKNFQAALDALTKRYGHPYLIARAHLESLSRLPTVKEEYSSLSHFVAELNSAVAALQGTGYDLELKSTTLLTQLLGKLPVTLRRKWGSHVTGILPNQPTLLDFNDWIETESLGVLYGSLHVTTTKSLEGIEANSRR